MLKEIRYDVIIISSSKSVNDSLKKYFEANTKFNEPTILEDTMNARRLLLERHFDIAIINSPLGYESGLSLALEINDQYEMGIMLLVKGTDYDEIFDKTNELGIITLSKPLASSLFVQSLKVLCLTRTKLTELKSTMKSEISFKEKMKEIQTVNEAKVLLMKNENMNEDSAHHYLEKKAMNERKSKYEIALNIIKKYKN